MRAAENVVRDRGRVLRHHRTARHAGSRPDQCPDGAAGERADADLTGAERPI